MELLGQVTEVLNQVVERRTTIRRQYPGTPLDSQIFPTNVEEAGTRRGAVDAVMEELAADFYLREAPEEKAAAAGPVAKLDRLELGEPRFEISAGQDVEASEQPPVEQRPAEKSMKTTEPKEEASSSTVPERTVERETEPSEEGRSNLET